MEERRAPMPGWFRPSQGHRRPPPDEVLTAISELADHVRASGLNQADALLTELLAVLHAEQDR